MSNEAFVIEVATYRKGKLTDDSGFIPQCFTSKELVERAIRVKANSIYKSIPEKNKPKIMPQFNSDAIFKGKTRVYFKDGYTELKPFKLEIIDTMEQVLEEVNNGNQSSSK